MLVDSIEILARYATSIHLNSDFRNFEFFVSEAETEVSELLGVVEYQSLLSNYPNALSVAQIKILPLVQRYISFSAVLAALPHLRNSLTEQGVQQVQMDSGALYRAAPVQDVQNLGLAYQQQKYLAADRILEFLEANIASFQGWKTSKSFTENNAYFIRNAKDYSKIIHSVNSRQTYLSVVPYLDNAENDLIRVIVGEELFEDLKAYQYAKIGNDNISSFPSVEYEKLLIYIRRLCANACLKTALVFLDFVIDGNNLYLASYNNLYHERTSSDQRRFEQSNVELEKQIKISEKILVDFLAKNYASYPKYENSIIANLPEKQGNSYCGNGFGASFSI